MDPDAGMNGDSGSASDATTGTDAAMPPPPPQDVSPCDNGACWDTGLLAAPCSYGVVNENFGTMLYNVHAYAIDAHAGVPTELTLTRTGGTWQPALLITDGVRTLSDGITGLVDADVDVAIDLTGADGEEARVVVTSTVDAGLTVFVTSWDVVASDFLAPMPGDATYTLRLDRLCPAPPGLIAPPDAIPGEILVDAGAHTVDIGDGTWGPALRVDAAATEHIGFRLDFSPSGAAVDMEVLAWDGTAPVSLAVTNAGPGLRVLAARDPDGARTFWVRAEGTPATGTMTITRTPLSDAPPCTADCSDLLQLPLPVDPMAQGYDMPSGVVFREQFGRRDLLTAIFHGGRVMSAAGWGPFTLKDLSNWDGSQPPGHATHNDGYHADISLYDTAGNPIWGALCVNNGLHCTGADTGFGAEPMALLIAAFFETGIVSTIYLDDFFIPMVRTEADVLLANGTIDANTHAIIHSNALRHVDHHFHHIHLRADGL